LLWLHLNRVSRAKSNPPRGLAVGSFAMLLVLSLVKPAVSHAPADLAQAVGVVNLDWFYLGLYPLLNQWPGALTWGGMATLGLILVALPWLPPLRRGMTAQVDLDNCNGCTRCAEDCPYAAITMQRRTDGKLFELEAIVNSNLCVACGICTGACPTATPFRRRTDLIPGIELPDRTIAALRDEMEDQAPAPDESGRLLVIGCANGADVAALRDERTGALSLPCIGMLPMSFIDYAFSRGLADGIVLTGCADGACRHRFGIDWTKARIARERDPFLRRRVPRDRLLTVWASEAQQPRLVRELESFRAGLPTPEPPKPVAPPALSKEPTHA
jgi:ferredoxin/coenzyme F420-reducing hydrogenase delta subunit